MDGSPVAGTRLLHRTLILLMLEHAVGQSLRHDDCIRLVLLEDISLELDVVLDVLAFIRIVAEREAVEWSFRDVTS